MGELDFERDLSEAYLDGLIEGLSYDLNVDRDELTQQIIKGFNFSLKNKITFNSLREKVYIYITDKQQRKLIKKAYKFAKKKHSGQKRKSGEPYIIHPKNVAYILACLRMDYETICAGLLHDVVEDTNTTIEEVEKEFGRKVAILVYGVTNLKKEEFTLEQNPKEAEDNANYKKFVYAATEDLRIIIIKLADRLHNMRTLGFMPIEKQKKKALDTIENYAPLARYTGIYVLKNELEDRSFRILNYNKYIKICILLELLNKKYLFDVKKTANEIHDLLGQNGIVSRVRVRTKSVYSMYTQLIANKEFGGLSAIDDVFAIKVIIDNPPYSKISLPNRENINSDGLNFYEGAKEIRTSFPFEEVGERANLKNPEAIICKDAQSIIKESFPFIEGGEKDYILNPRPNGYQSLHSIIKSSNGIKIHLQIRTENMNKVARTGIFSCWSLKKNVGVLNTLQNNMRRYLLVNMNEIIDKMKDVPQAEANKHIIAGMKKLLKQKK